MPFWSRKSDTGINSQGPAAYTPQQQNCYDDNGGYSSATNYPVNAYEDNPDSNGNANDNDGGEQRPLNKYAPGEQNPDLPMDLGTLQDIFSFEFIRGRPILNFILAILWSVGLPILLYHVLRPYIGQVLAMIVASCPPLAIVILRMIREKQFDPLGLVSGISFLISGILSIAQPSGQVQAICEGIVPLLVGLFCVISIIPIRIGSFELRPLVFQVTNQIMPRTEEDPALQQRDDERLVNAQRMSKAEKLDWMYTHLARFRRDMRVMTFAWGLMLIIGFFVKLIIILTNANVSNAENAGYIIFGLGSFLMLCFTWIYTTVVKGHVMQDLAFWREKKQEEQMDSRTEAVQNANWAMQSLNNTWGQIVG